MKKIITLAFLFASFVGNAQIVKVPYRGAFAPPPVTPWTDGWANFDPQNTVYPAANVFIGTPPNSTTPAGANITSNTTWTSNNVYEIRGLIYVTSGATLTIQPGTIIKGSAGYANSSLVICKGAKLIAEGTKSQPIVFTSSQPAGSRSVGNWGGIILLGKASYNGVSSSTSPVASQTGINYIEGITEVGGVFPNATATAASTEFGGGTTPDDNDNSGSLKYVRIEYGGYIFAQNKEINGLTMGAVGRGTTIDYVQCSFINDDAFEWFGGTVNCKHLISYRGVDDEWDTDNGFSGTVQFCLGVRDPQIGDATYAQASGGSTSEGYESDNDAVGSNNLPRTKAIFSNMTNIGPLRGDNSTTNAAAIYPAFRRAARVRRNSELKIFNSILADYPVGLMIDNALGNSADRFNTGLAKFKFNIVCGYKNATPIAGTNPSGFLTEVTTTGTAFPSGFDAHQFVLDNNNDTVSFTSTLKSAAAFLIQPYGTAVYPNSATFTAADYRPIANGLAATGADFTDSSFTLNGWTTDTCVAPNPPSAIVGDSSISGGTDTLSTFSITNVPGITYYWSVTGTGNYVKLGQGTNSVTIVTKNAGTVSVSSVSECAASAAVTKAILCNKPVTATSAISGVSNLGLTECSAYPVQTYSVTPTTGYTYSWAVTGTGNSISSTSGSSATLVMINAGTITVTANSGCQTVTPVTLNVTKAATAAPATLTGATVSKACGANVYRYTAPATLPAGYIGYDWTFTGTLGTNAVIDSGNGSSIIRVSFTSNSLAVTGDSVKVRYIYKTCSGASTATAYTPWKALKLLNTAITAPAAPVITATTLVSNVCGGRKVRYSVPVTPAGTTTVGAATGYEWSFVGALLGANASIDSGTSSSRAIVVLYTNNSASLTTDSARCRYTSDCGFGAYGKARIALTTALNPPLAPASITINSLGATTCGQPRYRYIAPALPIATTTSGAATGYDWTFVGSFVQNVDFIVDSGNLSSQKFTVTFLTGRAKALSGDSAKCRYNSGCGYGAYKAQVLTNTTYSSNPPATPASITATTVDGTTCGYRQYRYTAPVFPAGTATNSQATGCSWAFKGTLGANAVIDSGNVAGSNKILVHFTSNAAAVTGDSVTVRYTSSCGTSAGYAKLKLTNTALTCLTAGNATSRAINGSSSAEIYPNPNNGNFTLNVKTGVTAKTTAMIQIIDMAGRTVAQLVAENNNGLILTNINNNNLQNGMYIVKYTVGSVSSSVRMVVQK